MVILSSYPKRNLFILLFIQTWFLLLPALASHAQDRNTKNVQSSLPPAYHSITTDLERMRFLTKAITDSLNEGQLTQIYGWAGTGLAMAAHNKNDTMRGIFNFFIAKAFTYAYSKPDSAIVYYKKVLPLFPDKLRGYHYYSIREIMERYSEMGNKDSSFVYLDSLKALIDTMPETAAKKVNLSQNIATVYQWFGMFQTAIAYYQTAVKGQRKNGNLPGLGLALANLGELYDESGDDVKAVQYSKEALDYLANINMPYAKTAANLSSFYCNLARYDSALFFLEKSDSVTNKTGDAQLMISNSVVLADIYMARKKYDLARPLLTKNLLDLSGSGDTWNHAKAYISQAGWDTVMHQHAAATNSLLKALQISKDSKQEVLVAIALQNLAAVYGQMNDYKNAFKYQQAYIQQKDSMTNEKTKAALADFDIVYQTKQQEEQITLLKKDNDIKKLELQSSRRSVLLYLLASVMMLVIIAGIFYQRGLRHKFQYQQVKTGLETKVLRLQMNPHFIFNSLNSIENFIMRNEKRLASDYLNKFARLIRMILDSSRTEVVPIAKDMEALQLYIDLEQLRFNNKFSYKTYIDPALLGGDYRAPSLLIQPYVENAIVHGLAHSDEEDLNLTVTATLEMNKIKYVVQDNGVGREKSKSYNRQNKPYHQSMGLKITEDRINIFNREFHGHGAVNIIDLYDEQQLPDGTKVEITINAT